MKRMDMSQMLEWTIQTIRQVITLIIVYCYIDLELILIPSTLLHKKDHRYRYIP